MTPMVDVMCHQKGVNTSSKYIIKMRDCHAEPEHVALLAYKACDEAGLFFI